jgi:hypothetical protein
MNRRNFAQSGLKYTNIGVNKTLKPNRVKKCNEFPLLSGEHDSGFFVSFFLRGGGGGRYFPHD